MYDVIEIDGVVETRVFSSNNYSYAFSAMSEYSVRAAITKNGRKYKIVRR